MIPLQVNSISLSNVGFVVMLETMDGQRKLPIFIGVPEAQSIALQVNRVKPPRPMTHDLLKNIFDLFECRLDRVVITSIEDGTFYARLKIIFEERTLEVDSRPSDAIALALRCGVSIWTEETVLGEAGIDAEYLETEEEAAAEKPKKGKVGGRKRATGPQDELMALKQKLEEAIREERYEDAASLRDTIKKRESAN